jgi:hypothetical protein
MPPGSFTFEPGLVPLARSAETFIVARYDPSLVESGGLPYTLLPRVRCVRIRWPSQGPDPGAAQFRYVNEDPWEPDLTLRMEHVCPLDATGPHVVRNDERIVVLRLSPVGWEPRFDGYAMIPQGTLSDSDESLTFEAMGEVWRMMDTPLGGAIMRDAHEPDQLGDVDTDEPARFNPDGLANATAEDVDSGTEDRAKHPVFIDPIAVATDSEKGRPWTLGMAARYITFVGNPEDPDLVNPLNPHGTLIDAFLESWTTAEGYIYIDPANPDSYEKNPILVPDLDVTGDPWSIALHKLLEPHGFGMRFEMAGNEEGFPDWHLILYRTDDELPIKDLFLQRPGEFVDPGSTNVGALTLQRDAQGIINEWVVDTRETRYEASFNLAPGFQINSNDADAVNENEWSRSGSKGADQLATYRRFVFDEVGFGHWEFNGEGGGVGEWITDVPTGLTTVLGLFGPDKKPLYVIRPRPGIDRIFSKDAEGRSLDAQLWIRRLGSGLGKPEVWDGSPTGWLKVHTGFRLLDDGLGVVLDVDNPTSWKICEAEDIKAAVDAGTITAEDFKEGPVINIVKDLSASTGKKFQLRVTCVIRGDRGLSRDATAKRRSASPTTYAISRRDDTRDRFAKNIISKWSHLNEDGKDVDARDDTAEAKAHAEARRRANETAKFAGSVTIPRWTADYQIGDKIRGIVGRDITLRTNLGGDQGEAPVYPVVVGGEWILEPEQKTTLFLSDYRATDALPQARESTFD